MDPIIPHITPSVEDNGQYTVNMYTTEEIYSLPNLSTLYTNDTVPSRYITPTIRRKLDIARKSYSKYDPTRWNNLRKQANPFEHGTSIFSNRAAVKLANMDAIYGLTPIVNPKYDETRVPKYPSMFSFVDIAGGPGSFSEYVLHRVPKAMGYGITLLDPKSKSLMWYPEVMDKIKTILGSDGTGDVIKNYAEFANEVIKMNGEGVDLAMSDGAIGGNEEDPKQELDNFKLICAELATTILSLKQSGNFVCKIFEAETHPTAQVIYLMSWMFDSIDICKPISSRMGNSERYLIGLGFKGVNPDVLGVLKNVIKSTKRVSKIYTEDLPTNFVGWLTTKNDIHARQQLKFSENITLIESGGKLDKYNMYKAYSIWKIPDDRVDPYKVVLPSIKHKPMGLVQEVDNLIFKEITRFYHIDKMLGEISNALEIYWDNTTMNKINASKFMSIYLFDHLTDSASHIHDPVLPSDKFHKNLRYYTFLTHLSNNSVSPENSKKWFLSLKLDSSMKHYAGKLSNLKPSDYSYNVYRDTSRNGTVTYSIKHGKKLSYSITSIMDKKLNGLLKPEFKSRSKEFIFLLIMRYLGTLNSGNHQLGIPDYDIISKVFNLKEELFASPMNCSITTGYHSAFPDTDKFFGSLGRFSDTNIISGLGYSVNPPYTDIVLEAAMTKVVHWLNNVPDVIFYITIPVWDSESQKELGFDLGDKYGKYPAIDVVNSNPNYIKAKKIFHKDVFLYKDHNTNKYINASNTYIIILSNRELKEEEKEYLENLEKNRESERVKSLKGLIRDKVVKTYLDVGCGDGKITKEVVSSISSIEKYYMTDVLMETGDNYFMTNYDNIADSYSHIPDGSLDLVTMFVSLHHILKIVELLDVIKTKLKPDGIVFIREHNALNTNIATYLELLHKLQPDDYPSYFRSRDTIDKMFVSKGFVSVGYSEYDRNINPQKLYHEAFVIGGTTTTYNDVIVKPSPNLLFWMVSNKDLAIKLIRKYLRSTKSNEQLLTIMETSNSIEELKSKV
jgi:23S rRNA U2552 (ribose-2'-O)-methylase RlmE/FtsJ/SAM-dependent methyltransferase